MNKLLMSCLIGSIVFNSFNLAKVPNDIDKQDLDNATPSKISLVVVDAESDSIMATYSFEDPNEYGKFNLEKALQQLKN